MQEILAEMKNRMSEKRFAHTLRTAEYARTLALRFGEDSDAAYLAGLLHDCTKEWSDDAQLNFFSQHGIMISSLQKLFPQLYHARSAAIVAKEEFGMSDEVCSAIRWHTTGTAGMSRLDMILWLSDLIEPGRSFPGVETLRTLAEVDLEEAVLAGMEHSLAYLEGKKQRIDVELVNARNWLLSRERK